MKQLIHAASSIYAQVGDLVILNSGERARIASIPSTACGYVCIALPCGKHRTLDVGSNGLAWKYPHRTPLYHESIVEYRGLRFRVKFPHDYDSEPSWERGDGYGIISERTNRAKRPGERVIGETEHGFRRLYDVQETMKRARADGWNAAPYTGTKGERAARAVEADYNFHDSWLKKEWEFVIADIECLDTGDEDSCGGFETYKDYHMEAAWDMLEGMAHDIERRREEEARCRAEAARTAEQERIELQAIAEEMWGYIYEEVAHSSGGNEAYEETYSKFNRLIAKAGVSV